MSTNPYRDRSEAVDPKDLKRRSKSPGESKLSKIVLDEQVSEYSRPFWLNSLELTLTFLTHRTQSCQPLRRRTYIFNSWQKLESTKPKKFPKWVSLLPKTKSAPNSRKIINRQILTQMGPSLIELAELKRRFSRISKNDDLLTCLLRLAPNRALAPLYEVILLWSCTKAISGLATWYAE